jgi:putative ABC transport system permease protein
VIRLVWRNLRRHPIRSLLTVGSLVVALFLLCTLRTLVTTLNAGVEAADSRRLWVQSAVSLFVSMPASYQPKIEAVEGVRDTSKWQWFGGYYQDPSNFFAQFAADLREMLAMYPEVDIVRGSAEALLANRSGCLVGEGLAQQFGWKVGDTVPIIGGIFPHPSGGAWELTVEAIYTPTRQTFDNRTMLFHWELFEETLRAASGEPPPVGTFVVEVEPGADPTAMMATIDEMFAGGPQRVQTTTEAEFQRQFVSMVGNLPRFIGFIGMGVFLAILLACTNTMLMSGREQVRDVGILKALGFSDAVIFRVMLGQSLALSLLGGGLGVAFALASEPAVRERLGTVFPGYAILPSTIALGLGVALVTGLVAGVVPAWVASRLEPVDALGARE